MREITRISNGDDIDNRASLGFGNDSLTLGEYVPEVRYRNKNAQTYGAYTSLPSVSLPGYYYFAIGRDGDSDGEAITVEIDVDVNGTPKGKPTAITGPLSEADVAEDETSDAASPTDSTSEDAAGEDSASDDQAATKEDDDSSVLPWVGGGLLATLVALAPAGWFLRRRLQGQGPARPRE